MKENELNELLSKYQNGTCNQKERALLENWVSTLTYPEYQISNKDLLEDLTAIRKELPLSQKIRPLWPRMAAVAAVMMAILASGLLLWQHKTNADKVKAYAKDGVSGKQGGTFILASGEKVDLFPGINTELSRGAGIGVTKTPDGQVLYHIKESHQNIGITTAYGEMCRLVLPDSTIIYLNAGSSVEYHFNRNTDKIRNLALTGEAYFEVAKDKFHPFIVKTKGQQVEVLGTHFNINAYEDEQLVKTTLLEGSVKISGPAGFTILKPGEEAVNNGSHLQVNNVDTLKAVGWKNGRLVFDGDDLEAIMRKVSRHYNVNVTYDSSYVQNHKKVFALVSEKTSLISLMRILQYLFRKEDVPWSFTINDQGVLISRDQNPGKIDSLFKKRNQSDFR